MLWNAETLRPVNSLSEEGMNDVTSVLFATGDRYVLAATKVSLLVIIKLKQGFRLALFTYLTLPLVNVWNEGRLMRGQSGH